MRIYLSASECSTVVSALVSAYSNADTDTRSEIECLLKRVDACVQLQCKYKPKQKGKKQKI